MEERISAIHSCRRKIVALAQVTAEYMELKEECSATVKCFELRNVELEEKRPEKKKQFSWK